MSKLIEYPDFTTKTKRFLVEQYALCSSDELLEMFCNDISYFLYCDLMELLNSDKKRREIYGFSDADICEKKFKN